MRNKSSTSSSRLTTLTTFSEENKRWIVFGIALNYVLVPSIRPILEQEILNEYNALKLNHGIDVQTTHSFPVPKYPKRDVMKYENINGNDTKLKPPHFKKFDYSKFDYKVTSHVDLVKLFLPSHMAKLKAFDKTCDASAVLNLLGKIPVFSGALQNAANIVREGRNAWAHCDFTEWTEANFKTRFDEMKQLIIKVGLLPHASIPKVLSELLDWENKGIILCMSATIDPELLELVQGHVNQLSTDLGEMKFENQEEMNNLWLVVKNIHEKLQVEHEKRFEKLERAQDVLQTNQDDLHHEIDAVHQQQSSTAVKVDNLVTNQHDLHHQMNALHQEQCSIAVKVNRLHISQEAFQQRVMELESHSNCGVSYDFSNCEADINYYFERYDPDTRQWLLKDFDSWFSNPGNSRAYVLLGDAAVGKSVMAAVIAQRAQESGSMAAAFFCRHYDGTRRDPRYLLGTIAYQLCNCHNQYNRLLAGEEGIHRMLASSKLGLHELFTKLLEKPLSQCKSFMRKLVVIDALDESDYWSREDFLDLIMDRFPFLPKWLVFFITSRPEDTLQCRLKKYNPCIKICAGNNDSANLYQQHKGDIQLFLENKVDFSSLSLSPEELTNQCNGMFLYAFYIAEMFKTETYFGDYILPENIYGFFRKNFKRLYDKLGKDFYQKLFGCVVMSPSPLPLSFISFLLEKESLSVDQQEVIDAVSQFVTLRNTDNTFAFLHVLIPDWLTDEKKASRKLCVEKHEATKYYRNIIVHYLNAFLEDESENLFLNKVSLVNYMLCVGFYFLCKSGVKDRQHSEIIFNCLTNYRFLQLRIKSSKIGIYSLIDDLEFSIKKLSFDATKKAVLGDISSALERDKIILVGNHQLLHSCLCSSTCLVRNKVIPENMSGAGFRSNIKVPLPVESLSHIHCGAFSHDRKLFAAGKGQYLYLYDGLSFENILGPVEVMDWSISHLEFSPDDKYVFFGRLDRWFSVHEKCVVEVSQFSGKRVSYVWGSFICDGKYIAVNRPVRFYRDAPVIHELVRWANYELIRYPPKTGEDELLVRRLDGFMILTPKADSVKTAIRDYVVCNYAEIFEGQIWNVQTGRPVLEEMFTTQLEPFFYLWHIFSKMRKYPFELFDETITLSHVAVLNAWRYPYWLDDSSEEEIRSWYTEARHSISRIVNNLLPGRAPVHFRYSIAKTSRECYNFIYNDSEIFSKDGKWLLSRQYGHKIELFEREIKDKIFFRNRSDLLSDAQDVKDCVFTDDNDALVYSTTSTDLYYVSLVTGTKLRSISGLYSVRCPSGDEQELGFIFSSTNKREVVLLRDLVVEFLVKCWRDSKSVTGEVVDVTFTSCDSVSLLFSNGGIGSWKIVDSSLVFSDRGMPPSELMEFQQMKFFAQEFPVKKCFFSHSGELIVVDEGCRIVLFQGEKFIPIIEEIEGSVACLTFSADNSLILFCIKKDDVDKHFYIWNVNTSTLTGPLCFDHSIRIDMHIDCCCFSSDNSKLFFCNAFSVLILKHEPHNVDFTTLHKQSTRSPNSYICSHCTVSSDDKLLACCIGNEILIFLVTDPDKCYKVPHHLGQIQYCKFLGGKRYLLSYGIDKLMFLFDLVEQQPIAHFRHDSCIRMAISPNEDKIVCLESPDKMTVITLQGLESDLVSDLELFKVNGKTGHI